MISWECVLTIQCEEDFEMRKGRDEWETMMGYLIRLSDIDVYFTNGSRQRLEIRRAYQPDGSQVWKVVTEVVFVYVLAIRGSPGTHPFVREVGQTGKLFDFLLPFFNQMPVTKRGIDV